MNTEHVAAKVRDLKDGQMKQVKLGEAGILLLRVDGEYRAFTPECPHQGAPLADGVLCGGHVRCPWHQAVFDAESGALLQPPALDGLSRLDVRLDGDDVIVTLPDPLPGARPPAMARPDPGADGRTFAIIGAGAAGLAAAETLRQEGFAGRIAVITREQHLPYDRTELSKQYLQQADAARPMLRSKAFYEQWGIEFLTGREVTAVDTAGKRIACADGSNLQYDRLLLASGSVPRRLGVPGEELAGVFALRSLDDCERIRGALEGAARAVVVGASFIGMEAAAALARRGLSVTVVAPEPVPFQRAFGPEIGRMYQNAHEKKGVAFRLGSRVERFEGNGRLRAAVLAGGERLEADLAVVGVGVRPATELLEGIAVGADGGVRVDRRLRAAEDVYAAGDIAGFPDWRTGEPVRIEHWRLAQQLGRVAARNMAGREVEYRGVPFFWTNQFMVITQYVGFAREWDEIVYDGDPTGRQFIGYYVKGDRVLAAAGRNEERKMGIVTELLSAETPPAVEHIRGKVAQAEAILEGR